MKKAQGCAVGDGGLIGVDGIAHAEAPQEVEVEEGSECQCFAFNDGVVVGGEESWVIVDVCQEVVGVGDVAVAVCPDVADVVGGVGGIVPVGGGIVVLRGIVEVPFLCQHAEEAVGHFLGVGLGGHHGRVDSCQCFFVSAFGGEELGVFHLRTWLHVEPVVAGCQQKACGNEGDMV